MMRWTDLRMGFQKMVEHMQERQNVRLVSAPLSPADVIHNHVSDLLHAVLFPSTGIERAR